MNIEEIKYYSISIEFDEKKEYGILTTYSDSNIQDIESVRDFIIESTSMINFEKYDGVEYINFYKSNSDLGHRRMFSSKKIIPEVYKIYNDLHDSNIESRKIIKEIWEYYKHLIK